MSTYYYVACTDHDPVLIADDESGQHSYDLPDIRADIADREALVRIWRSGVGDLGYFRNNTVRFLAKHPTCALAIIDEYNQHHPLVEEKADA